VYSLAISGPQTSFPVPGREHAPWPPQKGSNSAKSHPGSRTGQRETPGKPARGFRWGRTVIEPHEGPHPHRGMRGQEIGQVDRESRPRPRPAQAPAEFRDEIGRQGELPREDEQSGPKARKLRILGPVRGGGAPGAKDRRVVVGRVLAPILPRDSRYSSTCRRVQSSIGLKNGPRREGIPRRPWTPEPCITRMRRVSITSSLRVTQCDHAPQPVLSAASRRRLMPQVTGLFLEASPGCARSASALAGGHGFHDQRQDSRDRSTGLGRKQRRRAVSSGGRIP